MTRRRLRCIGSLCAVGSLSLAVGCGGNHGKRGSVGNASYAACKTDDAPTACLRFLREVVGVDGIELTVNVPSQVTATCTQMAQMTRLRVTCPPLVPVGGVVGDHELYGPQIVDRRSYSMSINNGDNAGHIHWEVGAIRGPPQALWIFDRRSWDAPAPKRPARLIGVRRYLGRAVMLYRFPDSDGQLEGHDAAFATQHGVTYFVSIHGYTHDDGDIAMLLAVLARSP
jgi:hypothetical protein